MSILDKAHKISGNTGFTYPRPVTSFLAPKITLRKNNIKLLSEFDSTFFAVELLWEFRDYTDVGYQLLNEYKNFFNKFDKLHTIIVNVKIEDWWFSSNIEIVIDFIIDSISENISVENFTINFFDSRDFDSINVYSSHQMYFSKLYKSTSSPILKQKLLKYSEDENMDRLERENAFNYIERVIYKYYSTKNKKVFEDIAYEYYGLFFEIPESINPIIKFLDEYTRNVSKEIVDFSYYNIWLINIMIVKNDTNLDQNNFESNAIDNFLVLCNNFSKILKLVLNKTKIKYINNFELNYDHVYILLKNFTLNDFFLSLFNDEKFRKIVFSEFFLQKYFYLTADEIFTLLYPKNMLPRNIIDKCRIYNYDFYMATVIAGEPREFSRDVCMQFFKIEKIEEYYKYAGYSMRGLNIWTYAENINVWSGETHRTFRIVLRSMHKYKYDLEDDDLDFGVLIHIPLEYLDAFSPKTLFCIFSDPYPDFRKSYDLFKKYLEVYENTDALIYENEKKYINYKYGTSLFNFFKILSKDDYKSEFLLDYYFQIRGYGNKYELPHNNSGIFLMLGNFIFDGCNFYYEDLRPKNYTFGRINFELDNFFRHKPVNSILSENYKIIYRLPKNFIINILKRNKYIEKEFISFKFLVIIIETAINTFKLINKNIADRIIKKII